MTFLSNLRERVFIKVPPLEGGNQKSKVTFNTPIELEDALKDTRGYQLDTELGPEENLILSAKASAGAFVKVCQYYGPEVVKKLSRDQANNINKYIRSHKNSGLFELEFALEFIMQADLSEDNRRVNKYYLDD